MLSEMKQRMEEEKGIRRVSSIVMEHLESVEEARVMTEQLETRADLTEIGLDMDPTGEQDDEEARDEILAPAAGAHVRPGQP